MNLNKQNLINKILYRSNYRGSKEMDIFLSSFVKSVIYNLTLDELEELNNIVNLNDEEILKIYNQQSTITNYKTKIVELLVNFKNKN